MVKHETKIECLGDNCFHHLSNIEPDELLLENGSMKLYLDEESNQVRIKVKYSNGTIKTGIISLS